MELFEILLPHSRNINGLPALTFFSFPLETILYCATVVVLVLIFLNIDKEKIKQLIIGSWLVMSLLYTIQSGFQVYHEARLFGGKPLAELRNLTTANDFYLFLIDSSKHLPYQEPVTLFAKNNLPFYKQKAPYYLYPHSITENAKYFLIFDPENIKFENNNSQVTIIEKGKEPKSISDIKVLEKFSDSRYLIKKNEAIK